MSFMRTPSVDARTTAVLLATLRRQRVTTSDIASFTKTTIPKARYALDRLVDDGQLRASKVGRRRVYHLAGIPAEAPGA